MRYQTAENNLCKAATEFFTAKGFMAIAKAQLKLMQALITWCHFMGVPGVEEYEKTFEP